MNDKPQDTMQAEDIEVGMVFEFPDKGTWTVVESYRNPELSNWRRNKFYCSPLDNLEHKELFCFDLVLTKSRFHFRLPEMTTEELLAELKHWKLKAEEYKYQMEVNDWHSARYEKDLIAIAKLCGLKDRPLNSIGPPPDPALEAIGLVTEIISNLK